VPPGAGGNVAAPFLIGNDSFGSVTINGGTGLTVTSGNATVGDDATGIGILTVTGFGSSFSTSSAGSDFSIGNLGSANVTLSDMAQINVVDDLFVGVGDGSSGVTTITGFGTMMDVNDAINVGQAGEGTIDVLAGGRVFADDAVIGDLASGQGRVSVSGEQTLWRQTNTMTVGDAGFGTLEVLGGARLETTNVVIGNALTAVGVVDVDGAGTFWDVTGFMNLGVNGRSTLQMSNGARVTNTTTVRLATTSDAESHAVVSGPGSLWTVGTTMNIGEFGFGALEILGGGRVVTGDNVIIADNTNSRGEVTVDGENSTWDIDGTLDVSQPGEANLTISNGGLVTTTGVTRVGEAGELRLDGGRLHVQIAGGLTNNGLVRGGGTIVGAVTNSLTGEIRVGSGDVLVMNNAFTNNGLVDVDGGEIEVLGTTTNSLNIDVRGGVLRFQGGMTIGGNGRLAIVGGDVDVFGTVLNNIAGQVVVGGEAHAAFHDTFTNNGSLLVTPGAELLTLEDLTFGSGGSMTVQLADSDPIDGFGQVLAAGSAAVDGTLNVELVDDFVPALGDAFQIVTAGVSRTGTFDTENLPPIGGGLGWDVQYNPNSVVLSVVGTGVTGDYNNDGIVDSADYVIWRKVNNTSTSLPNDSTPNDVNDGDYAVWREHFGEGSGGGGGGGEESINGETAPEPGNGLIVFSLIAFVFFRRFTF
jgi:T5SS/PEP-CTERM-associated repeat protein